MTTLDRLVLMLAERLRSMNQARKLAGIRAARLQPGDLIVSWLEPWSTHYRSSRGLIRITGGAEERGYVSHDVSRRVSELAAGPVPRQPRDMDMPQGLVVALNADILLDPLPWKVAKRR